MLDPLDQLADIPSARDRLDDTELDLIDRARQAGATWNQVAEALGLGSRQAAEQRRQRLAAARTARRTDSDRRWPAEVAALRGLLTDLRRWIDADRRWDSRFPRAALTRRTTVLALEAEPGALYDLAARIRADLPAADPGLPTPVHAIAGRLAEALSMQR
ncbi:hypothetical protein [Micromonospora sediminimaris]|uniref:Uncharacterized protein n=1 Tax=Micromonospora sediminimaris TaxID=547162 RepID=A0A9W5UPL3_9ACTN|nr:hypothetical protein [Micromonospora sediminimaris]GIJ32847.1 hypothetical protein Vse01_19950 [Micromonospora sediminimaris]SFD05401.1 hypothetical protein SAMN05216284_110124 [Micromonospora sediminimaris]